jgi:hypothetical protein
MVVMSFPFAKEVVEVAEVQRVGDFLNQEATDNSRCTTVRNISSLRACLPGVAMGFTVPAICMHDSVSTWPLASVSAGI